MKVTALDHSLDSLRVIDSLRGFPLQCRQAINEISQARVPSQCSLVNNIVISGMGGSALGGRILANLERQSLRVPIIISTEYHLPNFVNDKTLVVVSSYSGNTEETLFSLGEARARNAQVFIIATGGKLADAANNFHLPNYIFKPTHNPANQPRLGLGYSIIALTALLSRCQLIAPPDKLTELPDFLLERQKHDQDFLDLAKKIFGKIPVIISSEHLKGSAHAFKNQLNENAKTFAVNFDLPEANHHLLEGLSFPKSNPANLIALFLNSNLYRPEIAKRYRVTTDVFLKQHISTVTYEAIGLNPFFQALDAVQTGAFVAYYLSLLNKVDPGPIPWVNYFKDQL